MIWDQLKNISTWDYGKLIIYSNIVNLNECKLRETNYIVQISIEEIWKNNPNKINNYCSDTIPIYWNGG